MAAPRKVFLTVKEVLALPGVQLLDGMAKFDEIVDAGGEGTNHWYHVILREGRKREVRRMWESQGVQVSRLIRVAYGPFQLGRLPRGQVREISAKVLREQLGDLAPMVDLRVKSRRRGKKSDPDV